MQNVTITNTGTAALVFAVTTYYYYQNGYLYKEVHDDGTISTPTSQTLLPSSAKVGDFGADMVLNNSDGSTDTSTRRIDQAQTEMLNLYIYSQIGITLM